jgi:hypothetical protein
MAMQFRNTFSHLITANAYNCLNEYCAKKILHFGFFKPVYSFRVLAAVKNSALYCTPFSQFRSIEMQLLNRNYCSTSKLCSTYSICLFFSMHNNLGYTANRDVGDLHFKSFNLRHEMSQVTEFSYFIPP